MGHREYFLATLAENEDDIDARLIYADWLEEHGETAEAERQRKWPESKAWLVAFCRNADGPSYESIIAAAMSQDGEFVHINKYENYDDWMVRVDEDGVYSGGRDASGAIPAEFWDHLAVVTGKTFCVKEEDSYFRCGC